MNNAEVLIKFKGDTKDVDTKTKKLGSDISSKLGSVAKGVGKAFGVASAVAVTAIASITKASVDAYAEYEQLYGGLESLFGAGSKEMKRILKTSETTFKTLTMSQNDYLEAFEKTYSIMKNGMSENGDAISYTNKMLQISADLFNTYGGSVETYSSAINWALKGVYSYVDNLNIGIKGTQEGFIDAANKAGILGRTVTDVKELTNDEIIDVIEFYAQSAGAMGRTAKEASTTILGSMNMMKASWKDLLSTFSKGDDLSKPIDNFVKSASTFVNNLLPVIERVLISITNALPSLINKITSSLPSLLQGVLPGLIQSVINLVNGLIKILPSLIKTLLPPLIEGVVQLTVGIIQALPEIITMIADMLPSLLPMIIDAILSIIPMLIDNLPLFIKAGAQLIGGLLAGIVNSIPLIIAKLYEIGGAMLQWLATLPSQFWQGAKALWQGFINGINSMKDTVIEKIKSIGKAIIDGFKSLLGIKSPSTVFNSIGKNLVQGLINGIGALIGNVKEKASSIVSGIKSRFNGIENAMHNIGYNVSRGIGNGITAGTQWVKNKVSSLVGNVTSFIKKAFKIGSPSKLMAQEVGQWIPKGIAVGITANADAVNKSMDDIQKQISMSMGMSPQVANSTALNYSPNISVNNQISMKQDPLGQMVSNIKTFSGGAKNDYNYGASI